MAYQFSVPCEPQPGGIMKSTLSRFRGVVARHFRKGPVRAAAMAVFLAAGAAHPPEARAGNLVHHLVSPGVMQVLSGDLDGDGVPELVTVGTADYQPIARVFRRSGDIWIEAESHALPNLASPILQLVPQSGPAGGPLGVLYATATQDTFGLGLLRNEGGTLVPVPDLVTGLTYQVKLPATVSTVDALPGGPGWTLIAGTAIGLYTFQGLTPQAPAFEPTPGFYPIQVLAADFSGDNVDELVVMGLRDYGPGSQIFIGQVRSALGGGGWGPWSDIGGYAQEGNPLYAIDMDNDGFRDLAFGSSYSGGDSYFVLPGSATGLGSPNNQLGARTRRSTRYTPADLDADGRPEVVTLSFLESAAYERTTYGFSVFRQDEWGGLVETSVYDVGPAAPAWGTSFDIAVGDLDGDGIPDAAFATGDVVTIYPGVGDGTFVTTGGVAPRSTRLALGVDPARTMDVVQLDGQGAAEIVVGFESATASLRAYGDSGGLSLVELAQVDAGPRVTRLATADLFGDGVMDVVTANLDLATAFAWDTSTPGQPGFVYSAYFEPLDGGSGFGEVRGMAPVDLSGDGRPDLVCASPGLSGDHFAVYVDDGSGAFLPPVTAAFQLPTGVAGLAVGNFTVGGPLEMLALNADEAGIEYVSQPFPGGHLGHAETAGMGILPATDSPHPFAGARFGGAGFEYNIVTRDGTGQGASYLVQNAPDSPFWHSWIVYACAGSPWAFATGDVDGDGYIDFAVACRGPDAVTLYRGSATGAFTRQDIVIGPGTAMQDVRISDVTGDGQAELLFITSSSLIAPLGARRAAAETVVPGALFAVSLPPSGAPSGVPDDRTTVDPTAGRVKMTISPNPVRGPASISFDLPESGQATLELFDVRGHRLATLATGEFASGRHEIPVEGPQWRGLASGVYCARLVTRQGSATRWFVRLR